MNENAEKLKELFRKKAADADKVSELEELRIEFLGKKGHIANLMSELRALPNDQKKEAGQKINTIKQFIESSHARSDFRSSRLSRSSALLTARRSTTSPSPATRIPALTAR